MAVSIRFYIFASDGMQRISQRLMEGLCHGHDAMPQFAGTKQKMANAIIELEHGKPARIVQVEGSYLQFDQAGKVHEFLQRGAIEAMEMLPSLERSERIKPSKVVDIAPKLKREKWERENRWTPAKEDLDLIADDIFNRKRVTSHEAPSSEQIPSSATFGRVAGSNVSVPDRTPQSNTAGPDHHWRLGHCAKMAGTPRQIRG